ncbi:MAG: glycoside hydrolase family 127 protein [Bacteroidales bacterium]
MSVLSTLALLAIMYSCKENKVVSETKTTGPEVVSFRALPFSISQVRLLDGPFLKATGLGEATLKAYEPDRFLAGYYIEAGLKPKAEKYHGWEDETIAGHSLGHYLSAISMMYQTTGDTLFLNRVNYIVSELKMLQDHDGDGYLGAFPKGKKILSEEVAEGDIRSKGFDLNGIWVPFYTEHKMMAGLRDAYRLCGNKTALEVSSRFADWLDGIVSGLSDEQVQKMLVCEHGGIAEVLADLYADTGNKNYLRMSRLFYQKAILDPLKEGRDVLPGKHCNTNIPKIIGLSRLYELTGDSTDRKAAEIFWTTVTTDHSYVTGGNGNNEYFGPARKLRDRLGEGTTESCNVYNMLKLTAHLFSWNAAAREADFYERALINHILSSQNPADGHVTYNLSLDMGIQGFPGS